MSDDEEKFRVIEYPFHLGDLVGGTAHLTNAQFGAYMRLLFANIQGDPEGIPLSKVRAYSREGRHFEAFWELVKDKFVEENGRVFNKRVRKTVRKLASLSAQNRDNRLKRNGSGSTTVQRNDDDRPTNHQTSKPINHKDNKIYVFDINLWITDRDREQWREDFSGWDFQYFAREFNQWISGKEQPRKPVGVFWAFCKTATKGKKP